VLFIIGSVYEIDDDTENAIINCQERTGHSDNGTLVAVAFSIFHIKCKKGAFRRNFGGLLDFLVWNFAEVF
jgi:hypothetical protein